MKEWQRNTFIALLFNIIPAVWMAVLAHKNILTLGDQISSHLAAFSCLVAAGRLFYLGMPKRAAVFALFPILLTTLFVFHLPESAFPVRELGWGHKRYLYAPYEFFQFACFMAIYVGAMLSAVFPVKSEKVSWDDKVVSAMDKSETYADATTAIRNITQDKLWHKAQAPSSLVCFFILLLYWLSIVEWKERLTDIQRSLGTQQFHLLFFIAVGLASIYFYLKRERTQSFWVGAGVPVMTSIIASEKAFDPAYLFLATVLALAVWQPELKSRREPFIAVVTLVLMFTWGHYNFYADYNVLDTKF